MLRSGAKTDPGKLREHNEDAYRILEEEQIYIIADGVGGSNAGEVASRTAVDDVADFVRRQPWAKAGDAEQLATWMKECVIAINDKVRTLGSRDPESQGMATTLVICYVKDRTAYFINVGDSRAYIRRQQELFQITEDHSYVNTLIKLGVITRDEAKDHKQGNVITQAVGAGSDIEADFYQTDLEDGDILLLCTDGLYGEISEETINRCIEENDDMQTLSEELVRQANDAGGRDNITVVCIQMIEGGSHGQ